MEHTVVTAGLRLRDSFYTLGMTALAVPMGSEIPEHRRGALIPGPRFTHDIDDIKSWPNGLREGEFCVLTEKLHGVFCCLGLSANSPATEPEPVVSSKEHMAHARRFDPSAFENAGNLHVHTWHRHAAMARRAFDAMRQALCERHPHDVSDTPGWPSVTTVTPLNVFLFGEVCGRGVQDLDYGLHEPEFRLFDIHTSRGGYEDWGMVATVAQQCGLQTVPVLHAGRWSEDLLGAHADGQSSIAAHHREGVVIRPAVERYDSSGPGRVIFKSLSARTGGTQRS